MAMGPSLLDLGCPKLTMGRTNARGLGKGPVPVRGSEPTRIVGSRKGGTGTPFGAGSCAYRVCSHLSGTDRRLQGMAGRTVNIRTMCSEQGASKQQAQGRGWLFESWRFLK